MTDGRSTLGVGWLQGTSRETPVDAMLAYLGGIFGEVKPRERGLQWYRESWAVGTLGVVVGADPRSSSSPRGEVYVVVPQSALDALGWAGQTVVMRGMLAKGVRFSRLDIYLDDRERHADPSDVLGAVEAGDTRSRVKAWRAVRDSKGGMTTYLGSRTGEFMVRVYRKWAESGDPEAGVRWEAEAKGERAPILAELLLGAPDAAAAAGVYLGVLRAFCDFVDRSGTSRGDRAPLLPWWAALVASVGRVVLAGRRVVDSLARRRAWFVRQCAPTLALLFGVEGSEGVSAMIGDAWERAPWALSAPALRWDATGGVGVA